MEILTPLILTASFLSIIQLQIGNLSLLHGKESTGMKEQWMKKSIWFVQMMHFPKLPSFAYKALLLCLVARDTYWMSNSVLDELFTSSFLAIRLCCSCIHVLVLD